MLPGISHGCRVTPSRRRLRKIDDLCSGGSVEPRTGPAADGDDFLETGQEKSVAVQSFSIVNVTHKGPGVCIQIEQIRFLVLSGYENLATGQENRPGIDISDDIGGRGKGGKGV